MFERGLERGDRSASLLRDYADSLDRAGDRVRALEVARQAMQKQRTNGFVYDLVARIQCEAGSEEDAIAALQALEDVDVEGRFYHHRMARFYLERKDDAYRALKEAEMATATESPPFEAFAVYADAGISLRDGNAFNWAIAEIERRFPQDYRKDVLTGPRCKECLSREDWRAADRQWSQLRDKSKPVHQALRARIWDVQSSDTALSVALRREAKEHSAELWRQLDVGRTTLIDPRDEEPYS